VKNEECINHGMILHPLLALYTWRDAGKPQSNMPG